MILYKYDCNTILVKPMKSRTIRKILRAYKVLHTRLCARGLKPKFQRLDNEAPEHLQQFMTSSDVNFQLVPPHFHRSNPAERAIRTLKKIFYCWFVWCRFQLSDTILLSVITTSWSSIKYVALITAQS